MPLNTEEDKVRGLSPYDLRRILGDIVLAGVKLLGKKSDDTFENIKSDDEGRLQVYDPKVGSLISYEGVTTTDGAGDGSSLIDSVLATKPDYDGNIVIITSGLYAGQARGINGATNNVTGTVTPAEAFGGQIVEGTTFAIIGIRTTTADVAAIEAKLDGASGLAAIKAVVDAILVDTSTTLEDKLDAIGGIVTSILEDTDTTLEAKLDAIDHIVDFHTQNYTGHIYYVDGTNGLDTNDGSIHAPFKTIAHAISVSAAGDRIRVRAGAYDEVLNMNLAGLELVCEQGTVLSNSTPGTALIVSAHYCRVVGAILAQAGQTGCQITGSFCSIEDCLAFGCATGFDDDGAETHFTNCRSILHTTTGFDISAGYGQYERLVAASTGAVRGIYLSNAAADHNHFNKCDTLGNGTAGWEIIVGADNNLFSHCSMGAGDGAKVDAGTNNTWNNFSEGSQIVAGQTRDQDLKDIYDAVAAAEVKLDKLAGEAVVEGTVTANWNTGTGTSGEAGEDLLGGASAEGAIGAAATKYKLHSLLLDVDALTDGAKIDVKLFMKVNGNERKVYDQEFTVPTTAAGETPPPDTLGLWIVNGTVAIHDELRVEVYSDTSESKAIAFTYVLEAM